MEYFKLILTISLFFLSKGKVLRDTITVKTPSGEMKEVVKYSMLEDLQSVNSFVFYSYLVLSALAVLFSIICLFVKGVDVVNFIGNVAFALAMAFFAIGSSLTDRTKKKY